jgi:hypothetical protein
VLDLRRDDVHRRIATTQERPFECQIVGLAPATGEHDPLGRAAEECGYLSAGVLQNLLAGRPAQ